LSRAEQGVDESAMRRQEKGQGSWDITKHVDRIFRSSRDVEPSYDWLI
jgi:hypothetical protein